MYVPIDLSCVKNSNSIVTIHRPGTELILKNDTKNPFRNSEQYGGYQDNWEKLVLKKSNDSGILGPTQETVNVKRKIRGYSS